MNSSDGHTVVGSLWFAIFLQLFLILGVVHTLATDSIAMHRFQISVFGAIAIVFAVEGINSSIYSTLSSVDAIAAGWFITAVVDILWTLYFTSEEDSLMLYVFNSLGTGGLTGPGRRRRRPTSVHNPAMNGYSAEYAAAGTLGPSGVAYDAKTNSFAGPVGSGLGVAGVDEVVVALLARVVVNGALQAVARVVLRGSGADVQRAVGEGARGR